MTDQAPTQRTTTLTGLPADEPFRLPAPDDFEEAAYLASPDLAALAHAIILHYERFSWGRSSALDVKIRYLWEKRGSKSGSTTRLGWCAKANGMTKFFTGVDYVIGIPVDAAAKFRFTNLQMEALLFHELCHVELELTKEGKLKAKLRRHDIEMFNDEVRYYGLWEPSLHATAEAFEQRPLMEADASVGSSPADETADAPEAVTIHPAPPPQRLRIVPAAQPEELVYDEQTGRYASRETGELVDPLVSAQLAGAQARVLAEQKRR